MRVRLSMLCIVSLSLNPSESAAPKNVPDFGEPPNLCLSVFDWFVSVCLVLICSSLTAC